MAYKNTDRNNDFKGMLNEFLTDGILKEEFIARDYVMKNIDMDETWACGADGTNNPIVIPFKASGGSSVRFGRYTAESEIAQAKYVRGKITQAKEFHGSMIFNHRDLMVHGKVSEQNFLKLLPGEIEDFMRYMKNTISVGLLSGRVVATINGVGSIASGIVGVSRPDRFCIGQLVEIFDGTTAKYADNDGAGGSEGNELFVIGVDVNTKEITLSLTRGGAAAVLTNISVGYVIHNHDAYIDGTDQTFQALPDVLLSAANGGSATYMGQTKKAYTFLQSYNKSGAAVTSTNIMEYIFDMLTEMRIYTKAFPTEVIMSLTRFADCMKILEFQKGAFNVTPGSQKGSQYGWMEIEVGSVKGTMVKLVGIQEADDDKIIAMDWKGLKFFSDGFLRKRVSPEGDEFYEIRQADGTGYQYIVDWDLFGEFVVMEPWRLGIMHSIP